MPNLPWVEAVKKRALRLLEKLQHKRSDGTHLIRTERAAVLIVREDVPRLLRAVEVLGEELEAAIARMEAPDGIDWEDAAECARRALADVRSLPSAPGATETD